MGSNRSVFHENPVFSRFTNKCLEKRDDGIQKVAILSKTNGKSKKKEAILSKNDDFGEVVQVPGKSKKEKTVKILKINWLYS